MGCYSLRFPPAGAPEGHVHPQRSALYQSGIEGRKGSFGCVGKVLGMVWGGWVCGACAVRWGLGGLLPRRAAPCSLTGTGAAGCCTIHASEASLPAVPCAPLCGARGAAPRSPNAPAPAGAKTFLLGGFSFPSAFEMRKEKPRPRPPYGSFCELERCPARKNKSAWLLFWVLFFAGGDTPRKKSTRSAPRVP